MINLIIIVRRFYQKLFTNNLLQNIHYILIVPLNFVDLLIEIILYKDWKCNCP